MGLTQFCLYSLFFFLTPSVALIAMPNKRRLIMMAVWVNLILLVFALWLFPQINRNSLAFGTLMRDLYCYLVLVISIVTGCVIKAVELRKWLFIPASLVSVVAVSTFAVIYSIY